MLIIPFVAAVANATSIAHYKWLLGKTELPIRSILALQFVLLFAGTALLLPFFGRVDPRLFEVRNLFLFGLMIVVATLHNLFWVKGIKHESLHEFEIIDLLFPVFTIILAAITFPDEREPLRLLLALLAAGTFLLTHLKKRHFDFKRVDMWLVLAVFLMAFEIVLIKPLLELMSPVSLYAVRTGLIACVFLVAYRPRLSEITGRDWQILGLNSFLGVLYMLLSWVSIDLFGIVVTEMVMLLSPMLLMAVSLLFFGERWTIRQSIAFVVILACIALVHLL